MPPRLIEWNEERIATLKKLWAEGWSGTEIAIELGVPSRCAVLGKAFRLGLTSRRRRERARCAPRARALARRPPRIAPQPMSAVMLAVMRSEPAPLRLTLLELTASTCRWPHGDPCGEFGGFCGHEVQPGSSYCPHHHRRAHW